MYRGIRLQPTVQAAHKSVFTLSYDNNRDMNGVIPLIFNLSTGYAPGTTRAPDTDATKGKLEAGAATIVHFHDAEGLNIYNPQIIMGSPTDGDNENSNLLSWGVNRERMVMVENGHVNQVRSSATHDCFAISKIIVKGT